MSLQDDEIRSSGTCILPSTALLQPKQKHNLSVACFACQERNLKSFFSAMEANVLRNIQRGDVTGSLVDEEARKRRESDPNLTTEDRDTFMEDGELGEAASRPSSLNMYNNTPSYGSLRSPTSLAHSPPLTSRILLSQRIR